MKKVYITIAFFVVLICIVFFVIFAYKNTKSGNNISKSDKENFLNISSYEATVEVEVHSNKNTNKYVLKQEYVQPNIFTQEVIEPENIKGLTTTYDGTNLTLENKSLDLKILYENYNCMQGSSLSLVRFIEEYKTEANAEVTELEDEITIKIELEKTGNRYEMYKKLYISKKTNLPTKMEILDINQNITVYILYREIKINKTSKEEVLAS